MGADSIIFLGGGPVSPTQEERKKLGEVSSEVKHQSDSHPGALSMSLIGSLGLPGLQTTEPEILLRTTQREAGICPMI